MNLHRTFIILCIVISPLLREASAQGHPKPPTLDCRICHECDTPTLENPCLILSEPVDATSLEQAVPEIITLTDSDVQDIYEPVVFNHKAHARMSQFENSCVICHHQQEKLAPVQSCKDCHTKGVEQVTLGKPGLKGAYHRQCLSCHTEWDHEAACETCHAKKGTENLEAALTNLKKERYYEPVPFDELIVFETEYDTDDKVPFHHKRHADLYSDSCLDCHQQDRCVRCHKHEQTKSLVGDLHPLGPLNQIELHETCMKCHESANCEHCHGQSPDYFFDHVTTGFALKAYHQDINCQKCHGKTKVFAKVDNKCASCHDQGWNEEKFDHALTGVMLDETHQQASCVDCHEKGIGEPANCDGCHDDKRTFRPETGFAAQ